MGNIALSRGISVTEDIKTDILFARLPPGEKLSVKMLSERYDCGASPLREALNHLANEGWVVRIDKRGFFVSRTSESEFRDILFNRCFWEAEALRRSIAYGDESWEERVVMSHFRLTGLGPEKEDMSQALDQEWEAAHKRFHMSLISACQSDILYSSCERLYDLNIRYRFLSGRMSYPDRRLIAEHNRIRDLTLARDSDAAVAALQAHYRKTGSYLFGDDQDPRRKTHETSYAG